MRFKTAAIAIAFVSLTVPTGAQCPRTTFDQAFASSTVVFSGRATAQEIVPAAHQPSPLPPGSTTMRETETTFQVDNIWKGELATTLRVRTCGWNDGVEAVSCSETKPFHVGERYIVFASGTPLTANSCVPPDSQEMSKFLASKPKRIRRQIVVPTGQFAIYVGLLSR